MEIGTGHKAAECCTSCSVSSEVRTYVSTYGAVGRAVVAHVPCAHRLVCKVRMSAQYDKGLSS